jgi:hypothetical protein
MERAYTIQIRDSFSEYRDIIKGPPMSVGLRRYSMEILEVSWKLNTDFSDDCYFISGNRLIFNNEDFAVKFDEWYESVRHSFVERHSNMHIPFFNEVDFTKSNESINYLVIVPDLSHKIAVNGATILERIWLLFRDCAIKNVWLLPGGVFAFSDRSDGVLAETVMIEQKAAILDGYATPGFNLTPPINIAPLPWKPAQPMLTGRNVITSAVAQNVIKPMVLTASNSAVLGRPVVVGAPGTYEVVDPNTGGTTPPVDAAEGGMIFKIGDDGVVLCGDGSIKV